MFPNMFPSRRPMSVHYDPNRKRFVVRWREAGRQRSKRFRVEEDAMAFDEVSRGLDVLPSVLVNAAEGWSVAE